MNFFVIAIVGLISIADLEGRRNPYPQNKSVIVGCTTELIWSLEADDLDVIIYKNQNIIIEDNGKYNIEQRYTKNGPVTVLTILNTTLEDTGLYSRQLKLTPERRQNVDIHLSVLDFKWRNDKKSVKVKVEDDVILKWAYDKIDLNYEIVVYRKLRNSTNRHPLVDASFEGNGIWNNTQMDPRIHFHIMSNGSTEFVELTLQNVTEKDMSYIYIIELDFGNSCVMREETAILIEDPRWSFKKEIEGQVEQNVSLNWKYYYSYPSIHITFNRRDGNMDYHKLGYWNGNSFFRGVDVNKFMFKRNVVLGGEEITLSIPNTVADDFNTTYGCNVTFSNGLTSYKELILNEGPRVDVPNIYIKGTIDDAVKLIFEYYYRFPATRINVMRKTTSGLNFQDVGYWTRSGYNSLLGDDRLIFQKQAILDGGKIYLGILDTTSVDYNTTYRFSVLFENRQHVSTEIHLILLADPQWSFKKEIEGQVEQNVSLNWKYYYSYPSIHITFNRRDGNMDYHKLGYWNGNSFFRGVDVNKFMFKRNVVLGGEEITLSIPNTVADDFNTTYGCNVTFSNGLTSYKELILNEGPRVDVPNIYIKGTIDDAVKLIFEYYYRFPATRINVMRKTTTGLNFQDVGYWTRSGYNSLLGDDRLIFQKQAILDGGKIYLGILDTTSVDYNTTYRFSVLFENRQHVSTEIHLILLADIIIESGSLFVLNLVLMTVLPILAVLICVLVGLGIYGYKRKSRRVVSTNDPVNNTRHSYISLNSVVIFHANRDSTTTSAESTASNSTDDDTNAYANPYDSVDRDGIDTSKNFYMSLQNPGTSNINQGDDVQETNVDSNSVTNIDDAQTADDDDDDDDTSTHDSNPYDAMNKYTMNRDIHSYLSLPPCARSEYWRNDTMHHSSRGDDLMFVKKRPSTI